MQPDINSLKTICDTIETQGAAWGARKAVIQKAETAMNEFMESLVGLSLTRKEVTIDMRYDEMDLNISISYEGKMIDLEGVRPSQSELLEEDAAVFRLSSLIVRHHVDRIKTDCKNGKCHVFFHFEQ